MPDEQQGRLIETLIRVEWSALESEATAGTLTGKEKIEALRLAAEYRRQLLLIDRDLTRTIARKPAPASTKAKPSPSSLPDIVAELLAPKAPIPSAQVVEQPDRQLDLFGDSAE